MTAAGPHAVAVLVAMSAAFPAMAATAAAASPSPTQTIYRCGNDYALAPCAGASVLVVDAAPSLARRSEAEAVVLREKRLAAEMARDRRLDEAAARPALATSLGPSRAAAVAATPAPKKKAAHKRTTQAATDADKDFIAAVPRAKKSR